MNDLAEPLLSIEEVADALLRDFNILREVIHYLRERYWAVRFEDQSAANFRAANELAWHLPEVRACNGKSLTCTATGQFYDLPTPNGGRLGFTGVILCDIANELEILRMSDNRSWRNIRRFVQRLQQGGDA